MLWLQLKAPSAHIHNGRTRKILCPGQEFKWRQNVINGTGESSVTKTLRQKVRDKIFYKKEFPRFQIIFNMALFVKSNIDSTVF